MQSLGKWLGIGLALGIAAALVPVAGGRVDVPVLRIARQKVEPEQLLDNPFEGLDLTRIELHPTRVTAPLPEGKRAQLTIDPELQRMTLAVMKRFHLPEAGAVLMDVKTGALKVYASHVNVGEPFDVNARAEAPAASIFKVITGAALVEHAGLDAGTEQCYHGGHSRVLPSELEDDPVRDKWCATLATAMGRSLNVVFARLARKNLSVEQLTQVAGAFGFGVPIPFEVINQAPAIALPEDPIEFARAAAGFWHTSLSPLGGASIAQTVASGGVTLKPRVVERVTDANGEVVFEAPASPTVLRRAVRPETARELTKMMLQTTKNGSAYKTFFDRKGRAFLPNIPVAGKTGTLTRHKQNRHYTWFIGFAPADDPEVAVAALIVNTPRWRIKGPELARDVLRAYFAQQGRAGVSRP